MQVKFVMSEDLLFFEFLADIYQAGIAILFAQKLPYVHTHTFNGPLSRTTRVSWYQKGKTNLDFTEARDS